ncbi:hypothetical protein HMN09_00986800 [Mycena chlorophos]|uniref:AA1-like domain-containing protein n=1 Tax=Mycena chlorophos TaxID=658473 RepID=A0A8H6VZD7_MYCCL|nr:hypothetical protein HMN09_00986800 [Mycena chlorophos]
MHFATFASLVVAGFAVVVRASPQGGPSADIKGYSGSIAASNGNVFTIAANDQGEAETLTPIYTRKAEENEQDQLFTFYQSGSGFTIQNGETGTFMAYCTYETDMSPEYFRRSAADPHPTRQYCGSIVYYPNDGSNAAWAITSWDDGSTKEAPLTLQKFKNNGDSDQQFCSAYFKESL